MVSSKTVQQQHSFNSSLIARICVAPFKGATFRSGTREQGNNYKYKNSNNSNKNNNNKNITNIEHNTQIFIHSFIPAISIAPLQVLYYYSTDNISEFHAEAYRQLQVKDLPKVPTWRLERESNP